MGVKAVMTSFISRSYIINISMPLKRKNKEDHLYNACVCMMERIMAVMDKNIVMILIISFSRNKFSI